jgi:hypothetical protein
MTIFKILATLVGGAIVIGLLIMLFVLLWWLIVPLLLFGLGATLFSWGTER